VRGLLPKNIESCLWICLAALLASTAGVAAGADTATPTTAPAASTTQELLIAARNWTPTTAPTTEPAAEALRIVEGPYLQAPTENSMTVVWLTNRNCVSKVEYGRSADALTPVINSHDGLIDADTTLHRVTIDGLSPGTHYSYRVSSTEIVQFTPWRVGYGQTVHSGLATFTTLDSRKAEASFVVLNDRHAHVVPLVAALKRVDWSATDMVLYDGDMLDYVQDEPQMLAAIATPSVSTFATQTPFLLVRGNHEKRGRFARDLARYFPLPGGQSFGAFNDGPVRVIFLDSGEDKPDASPPLFGLADFGPYLQKQADWLKHELASDASRKSPFRVAVFHIPPTSLHVPPGTPGAAPRRLMAEWVPLLNDGKVDVILCGHLHKYSIRPADEECHCPVVVTSIDGVTHVHATREELDVLAATDAGIALGELRMAPKNDTTGKGD
jgi:acid phosphatase type 7